MNFSVVSIEVNWAAVAASAAALVVLALFLVYRRARAGKENPFP